MKGHAQRAVGDVKAAVKEVVNKIAAAADDRETNQGACVSDLAAGRFGRGTLT
jgi:hypothetical protein